MAIAGVARAHNAPARVMLVEDSAVVRGMVRNWLEKLPGIELVESASNGRIAIDMVAAVRPDVIILDIEMPVMDGMTALPEILRRAPQAKVLIASTLSQRNAEVTLKAMSLGAADYIPKPSFARDGNDARKSFQEELERKILGLAGVQQTVQGARSTEDRWTAIPDPKAAFKLRAVSPVTPRILAIGSSTGGPTALNKVFSDAAAALGRVPVVVTQHMPPTFTALLGEKLSRLSGLAGGEAKHGEAVVAGRLYVAPGGMHMRLKRQGATVVTDLSDGPPINHCRPAVDPLFDSVAEIYGSSALGIVLTGMGSDGAKGAVRIADAGGTVFVQDAHSSVVWGMPGAAAQAGAAAAIVPLDEIGARITRSLTRGR